MSNPHQFYTANDIAEMMHICYQKALDFIKYSGIPYMKIGRTYHISTAVFEDFICSEKNVVIDLEQSQYDEFKRNGGN